MDYLSYFGLNAEPFSNAPLTRFYYGSAQHTEALERLMYAAKSMKGLAVLVGDIGLGKTTLARRMLEALPEKEYEAAMLVIVHAGITTSWLLKRIAMQLGVAHPADDKLTILSQLYQRLVEVHEQGRRAVVLIDEAQMLESQELMEEFRGLLNLEVPEHKLITFVFFGLPDLEKNLRLDPPLAQRIALRYHLKPLGPEDTAAYIEHRLSLAGAGGRDLFSLEAIQEIFRQARGVPRLINTLCDNLLLEMFFARAKTADWQLVANVAKNLGMADIHKQAEAKPEKATPDELAVEGAPGHDAIVAVGRNDSVTDAPAAAVASAASFEPAAIAEAVASEPFEEPPRRRRPVEVHDQGPPAKPMAMTPDATTVDIADPLAFLNSEVVEPQARKPESATTWKAEEPAVEIDIDNEVEIEVSFEETTADHNVSPEMRAAAAATLARERELAAARKKEAGVAALAAVVQPAAKKPAAKPATPAAVTPAAPSAAKPAAPSSAATSSPAAPAKGKSLDLKEIDDLLADLNARKAARRAKDST